MTSVLACMDFAHSLSKHCNLPFYLLVGSMQDSQGVSRAVPSQLFSFWCCWHPLACGCTFLISTFLVTLPFLLPVSPSTCVSSLQILVIILGPTQIIWYVSTSLSLTQAHLPSPLGHTHELEWISVWCLGEQYFSLTIVDRGLVFLVGPFNFNFIFYFTFMIHHSL